MPTPSLSKRNIKGFSYEELVDYFGSIKEKPFRATQVFEWIYQKGASGFEAMSSLPISLRNRLQEDLVFNSIVLEKQNGSADQTNKFLFSLNDKEKIETVLIPAQERTTVCVSTQAGCKFKCGFCASGLGGLRRNLDCGEIIDQILYVKQHSENRPLSHVVFMGVGEPLDNYDNVVKAIRIINSPQGDPIAARRITISTCGLIPQIQKLSQEKIQVELAVSLHGSNNDIRGQLMPVNRKYPLADLVAACRSYIQKTNRQVTFEYILIKNLTCTEKSAEELGKLFKGMICKINLIPYNKVEEFPHEPPTKMEMLLFKQRLAQLGVHATIRMPRGKDVNAACGQLRHSS
ncbi:MAG: 23S rRNA (adenine(2503)-C(2))-methyltransferase RlmN [Candidatus Omnitrophota bacterium]